MALHKFSKIKSFHVDYCGCTAATSLLSEQSIRDAINFIRQNKPKREFIKTTVSVSKDGVKIIYGNDHKYSTHVPTSMIAGSTTGKSSLHDTVGVVYISPLTGRHYPAFIHIYRCDSTRTAQKLLSRLRAYTHNEKHRSKITQLEQHLLHQNLLNLDHYDSLKLQSESSNTATLNSDKTNTNISTSSTNSSSRQDRIDPVKSITEEFQKKLESQEPLLFPPKDYDTVRASHGNIQRAQAWKSTEPTIVGYTPIDPDNNQTRRQTFSNYNSANHYSSTDELQKSGLNNGEIDKNGRPRFVTQRSDTTMDPVETVSLAFDFLKDETGSIFTENDGNIEHLDTEKQDKQPIFRFRPPPITAITKKLFTRNNNYELSNNLPQQNPALKNELNAYYHNAHYQQRQMPYGNRTRSETNLLYEPQPRMHLSPRYESRLVNGSGAPISTNPLWAASSPIMIGSQPNLLSYQSCITPAPHYYQQQQHQLSSPLEQRITSAPLQHPLYASYPNNNAAIMTRLHENQMKRPVVSAPPPPPPHLQPSHLNRKQTTQSQFLDTNEFILRASDGSLMSSSQYSIRPVTGVSRNHRPHSINVNDHDNSMLDVYY
ncbi:unnamed protein product [Rotaria socialis]|uniref:PID domain-containing protein n=1 Tax=Rotaria socialis TaxID=392032 RepID=A0A817VX50_9BILA|nr:unnamed protein product [Rotaria socialis]CAF3346844.1 unnamed protein product [Rotaria socialis]CAF3461705.1 unnamed protein product [Rotaria socialis]CAF3677647.1 unnamed protein product [Rotaria socialis]CAF4098339.1 unnamed protein product [Rotaria socialis]